MKFIVTYVGAGAKAFPLGNLAELAQAKEALRSAHQKTAQVYRGNPHDPSTWRREGRLTAAPPKKSNARTPGRRKRNAMPPIGRVTRITEELRDAMKRAGWRFKSGETSRGPSDAPDYEHKMWFESRDGGSLYLILSPNAFD